MTIKMLGRKKGMARLFDKAGNLVVCTVIAAEPNVITQIKTKENDGYNALQLGAATLTAPRARKASKARQGHFAKAGVAPREKLHENRVDSVESFQVGQEISVSQFEGCAFVDVTGVSKGKGYQGVMKRHNYAGGPASHGSGFHRHAGSTGMRTSPGRNLPGGKKAGRMGAEKVTTQGLRLVIIDQEKQVIAVEGSVPGPRGGFVTIAKAKK